MRVSCILCDREIETRDEDVYVTVSWILSDILKKNNLQISKNIPRVAKLCSKCWQSLDNKPPPESNTYWMFNKTI
ncbi:MAG: hypothetical protein QXI32_03535 [Candidatus Bathyarchaeia archaeon]